MSSSKPVKNSNKKSKQLKEDKISLKKPSPSRKDAETLSRRGGSRVEKMESSDNSDYGEYGLINPYFKTNLHHRVTVHPDEMNNDIKKNMKFNLEKALVSKCFNDFGIIMKIYSMKEISDGEIPADDFTCSAKFDVKFSCKICRPLVGTLILCQVESANRNIVQLRSGPINIFVFSKDFNVKKFVFDESNGIYLAKQSDGTGIPIVKGVFVKVLLTGVRLQVGQDKILALGMIEDIASKKEIKKMLELQETDDMDDTEFDKYMELEKKIKESNTETEESVEYQKESDTEYNSEADFSSDDLSGDEDK